VFGSRALKHVMCRSDGNWVTITYAGQDDLWTAKLRLETDRPTIRLTVRAEDESGRLGQHIVEVATSRFVLPTRPRGGTDAASVGAWPENGVLGTQLGPNRNAKPLF
jgi:Icc protein